MWCLDELLPSSAPEGWVCATPLPGSGVMSLPPSHPSQGPQTPGERWLSCSQQGVPQGVWGLWARQVEPGADPGSASAPLT